ncbi:MAG: MopE-related protein [Myxococcota bacterium]
MFSRCIRGAVFSLGWLTLSACYQEPSLPDINIIIPTPELDGPTVTPTLTPSTPTLPGETETSSPATGTPATETPPLWTPSPTPTEPTVGPTAFPTSTPEQTLTPPPTPEPTPTLVVDEDLDGFPLQDDCNDQDASINPGAADVCDGRDNNCNGLIDDGYDLDRDGYATCWGLPAALFDCDDGLPSVYPGAPEACDGLDNDCDGVADDNAGLIFYRDEDGDLVGGAQTLLACSAPAGYVAITGDCNDANSTVYPGAQEVCDRLDNDCDSQLDEGFDADRDGYSSCAYPVADCDDQDPFVYPGRPEVCDARDENCDGSVDQEWQTGWGLGVVVQATAKAEGADGTTAKPFPLIQQGLGAAGAGCLNVFVLAGTYNENLDFIGLEVHVKSVYGPESTIIDGGTRDSVVEFTGGELEGAAIEGFTLRNGRASLGGGIRCIDSQPTVIGNIIQLNTATQAGGGAYLEDCDMLLQDNVFRTNTARASTGTPLVGSGAGLYVAGGSPILINNTFQDNLAAQYGGAIALVSGASPWIEGGVMDNNAASPYSFSQGGAIYSVNAQPRLKKVRLLNNNANDGGGGIYLTGCDDSTNPCELEELYLQNNRAVTGSGGGLYVAGGDQLIISRCTFTNNSAVVGGGGASILRASPRISNSLFHCNNATSNGGALYLESSFGVLLNNTMLENTAGSFGGGIYFTDSNPSSTRGLTVVNNLITRNRGGVTHAGSQTAWSFRYNDVFSNTLGTSGSNYVGMNDPTGTNGNISADPLLNNHRQNCDVSDDNLEPIKTSPLVDYGENTELRGDIRGQSRPRDGNEDGTAAYDIGAWER